jgi:hypothetical protein
MSVKEIQQAVQRMPAAKRRQLTTWMVTRYPALTVEGLLANAERRAKVGTLHSTPPTVDNVPTGATAIHVKRTAKRLGLAK